MHSLKCFASALDNMLGHAVVPTNACLADLIHKRPRTPGPTAHPGGPARSLRQLQILDSELQWPKGWGNRSRLGCKPRRQRPGRTDLAPLRASQLYLVLWATCRRHLLFALQGSDVTREQVHNLRRWRRSPGGHTLLCDPALPLQNAFALRQASHYAKPQTTALG